MRLSLWCVCVRVCACVRARMCRGRCFGKVEELVLEKTIWYKTAMESLLRQRGKANILSMQMTTG